MTVYTVSSAWKPENGRTYGTIEVRMADDFVRADASMWGIVEAKGLDRTTTFGLLRIVGRREWHPRFDWHSEPPDGHPWQAALGGNYGGTENALAGLFARDCKHLHIKRLEISGVPGAGVYFQRTGLEIDSSGMDRVGWPLFGHHDAVPGARLLGITSGGGHWWSKAWPPPGFGNPRAVSLRRLDATHYARGELVMVGGGWTLQDYTHHGDGISLKVGGTEWTVRRARGAAAFFSGTPPQDLTNPAYADPVLYRHMHESRRCLVEDSEFIASPSSVAIHPQAMIYVSYPFTEPLVFRRCVFFRGGHPVTHEINYANVVFEDCDFIGCTQETAFRLSPGYQGMPPGVADTTGSRFYSS